MAIVGKTTLDDIVIVTVDADPSANATPAPIGSIAIFVSGGITKSFNKTGAGDTAWSSTPDAPGLAGVISTIQPNDAAAAGTATTYARGDHKHANAVAVAAQQTPDQTNAAGSSTSFARADHIHNIPAAAPSTIGTANAKGTAASFALSDHVHNHGAQTDGSLHAAVTTSVNGFMAAADKTKLDGISTGATNTPLASVAPADVTKAAAAVGVGTTAARADHKHDISTAAAASLNAGSTSTEGTATSLARSDHTHAIASGIVSQQTPDQTNAAGTSTNFAKADHVHNIPTAAAASVGATNTQGAAATFSRADHGHQGIHSLKANAGGTARFNDIVFLAGTNTTISDDGSGNFTFASDEASLSDQIYGEDFWHNSNNTDHTGYSFDGVTANGGVATVPDTITGNDFGGVATIATGVTNNATGIASVAGFGSIGKLQPGALRIIAEQRIRIPTLSTAGVSYTVKIGLTDGTISGLPVNGVFFFYTHGTNSGRWRCTARSASTSTNNDSAIVVTANQWYKLKFDINAAANSVSFYIDGVLIGSAVTTNIPTAAMFLAATVEKANTTTTSRTSNIDYFYWKLFR